MYHSTAEYFPVTWETLGLIPNTERQKQEKEERRGEGREREREDRQTDRQTQT